MKVLDDSLDCRELFELEVSFVLRAEVSNDVGWFDFFEIGFNSMFLEQSLNIGFFINNDRLEQNGLFFSP
jgi:hypothetical protein